MIKAKIISKEEAIALGLTSTQCEKCGSGSPKFILGASGNIGETVANKIIAHNTQTHEQIVLIENGKTKNTIKEVMNNNKK